MSSIDPDVNINLNAQDNASPVIDNSVKNIDRSFIQMRNGLRANERSFYLQHQSIFKFNQVMGNLRTITGAGINIMNTLLLTQIRNQAAAKNLRDATRNVTDAQVEFGIGSKEHIKALEEQNEIIKEQEHAVIQDTLAWVQMGTYLASTLLPLIIKIASRMRGLRGGMKGGMPIMPCGCSPMPTGGVGNVGGGKPGGGKIGGGSATQTTSKRAIVGRGIGVGAGGAIGAEAINEIFNIQPYQSAKGETWWQENVESLFKPTVVVNINNNSQGIYGGP